MSFPEKSTAGPGFDLELKIWTEWHTVVIGSSLIAVLSGWPMVFFPAAAAVSFSALIHRFRTRWTPSGRFELANTVTLFRLVGIFVWVSSAAPTGGWAGTTALLLFALDGVDGWIARRWHLSSEFGEFFDKEVDAFFLLALCVVLYTEQRLGWWILIPGLLRYLFVAYLKLLGSRRVKEQRSRFGCWSYCLTMLSAILGFLIPEPIYAPLIGLMSLVLGISFADSIRRLHWADGRVRES